MKGYSGKQNIKTKFCKPIVRFCLKRCPLTGSRILMRAKNGDNTSTTGTSGLTIVYKVRKGFKRKPEGEKTNVKIEKRGSDQYL
ncbi:hypothetical protein L1987_66724 [Smallanthus sonchifolius]|uniref:Uncharacterized protein n=1 Tax=Smallanthus sonchifolius TaxID=185202 RepID=A0ACB9BXX6_9ASTR|nr:hypothetical protein L1987_66724 [Smallanthus sonchifolius]